MLTINRKAPPEPPPYTILDALLDFATKKKKGTLMLVHRETGKATLVRGYDPATKQAVLGAARKRRTATVPITERESNLYWPMWR